MANNLAPFGFRQFRHLDGSAPTAGFDTLVIASSDTNLYFTGDPVATSATGPYITVPSSFGPIRGTFLGCEYYSPSVGRKVWSPYFPGSVQTSSGTSDAQAFVCTDPDMLYIVQGSSVSAITSSMIGLNFIYQSTSAGVLGSSQGNTTTGVSVVTLASSTFTTSSSGQFRLLDLYSNWAPPGTNGTDNTSAGNIVVVAPNNWDRKNLTGI